MRLSITDLQSLAESVGFTGDSINIAAAVAMAESGGDPNIAGDAQYGGSNGLWQVNIPSHRNYDPQMLFDPVYNAKAAYAISSGGTNWKPWTTYRTGAYKKFMAGYVPGPMPTSNAGKAFLFVVGGLAIGAAGVFAYGVAEKRGMVPFSEPPRRQFRRARRAREK